MKMVNSLVFLALALPILAFAADGPNNECSIIKWNPAFLKQYPKAPITCRDVTVKDGVKYAQFVGIVSKVESQRVYVDLTDVANIPVSKIAFDVGTGGTVTINNAEKPVKDLKLGDVLTLWVKEGEFGVLPAVASHPLRIVNPSAMAPN